jgi:hypothetical protein
MMGTPHKTIFMAPPQAVHPASAPRPIWVKRTHPMQTQSLLYPPKADMCSALAYVCFGPKADSCTAATASLFDHLVGALLEL